MNNKTDRLLAKQTMLKEKMEIIKIRNKRGDIINEISEIKLTM